MVARKTAVDDREPEFITVNHFPFSHKLETQKIFYTFMVIAHRLEQIIEEFELSRFQARIY